MQTNKNNQQLERGWLEFGGQSSQRKANLTTSNQNKARNPSPKRLCKCGIIRGIPIRDIPKSSPEFNYDFSRGHQAEILVNEVVKNGSKIFF